MRVAVLFKEKLQFGEGQFSNQKSSIYHTLGSKVSFSNLLIILLGEANFHDFQIQLSVWGRKVSQTQRRSIWNTWGRNTLSLAKESFSNSNNFHLAYLGKHFLSVEKESFSYLKKIYYVYLGKQYFEFGEGKFLKLKQV